MERREMPDEPRHLGVPLVVSKTNYEPIDTGPAGFHNNTTMSRGPWPSPQVGDRRDVASTTLNPNRIGHTSQTPMESNFYI
jgi:hypothetical protein